MPNESGGGPALPVQGLTQSQASALLARHGPNEVPEAPPISIFRRFVRQFRSPIIWLLLFALAFDLGIWLMEGRHGVPLEAIAIAAILSLNAALGVYQEHRADAALSKLKTLNAPLAWVFRDGGLVRIPARDVVPGDVARVEAGDRIPADGVLAACANAMLDESVLTGESAPVEKSSGDEAFGGTQLVRGRSLLQVARTGSDSALGKLAVSLQSIEIEKTPLEKKLDLFGQVIARWVLGLAALILVLGLGIEGIESFNRVLLFAVALAVAAVPEGMPAVLTLTLARGIERMAARKAVVRRMSAVEALGSVTVTVTDKTGTLTENQMFVRKLLADDPGPALAAMILANDADPAGNAGDPLELALYAFAVEKGHDPAHYRSLCQRLDILPFDSDRKYMRVTCETEGRPVHYLKGAPEILLERATMEEGRRALWHRAIEEAASAGHRLLALASSEVEPESDLRFLGVVLLWDPPRPEVPEAIRLARAAGVRVIMATGDHPATAVAVAETIGLPTSGVLTGDGLRALKDLPADMNVLARVMPEDKLRLISLLKAQGEIVAMTGDGVNDAPALKRADVGIAMGQRGSDVAREVADLVLLDDNFATLVAAIEQGRGVYRNIQKFIRFLFSTNLAEVCVVVGGAIGSFALDIRDSGGALILPLTAAQLLWVNLVTDGPAALALGLDENPKSMAERPRDPRTPLLDAPSSRFILAVGAAQALVAMLLLVGLRNLGLTPEAVRTAVFHYLVLAQLATAYPARGVLGSQRRNWGLALAVALGVGLQLAVAFAPSLRSVLGLQPLEAPIVGIVLGSVVAVWLGAEAVSRSKWLGGGKNEAPAR